MAATTDIKMMSNKLRALKSLENALSKDALSKKSVYTKFAEDTRVDEKGKPLLGAGTITALAAIIAALDKKTPKATESAQNKHASLLTKVTEQVTRQAQRLENAKAKAEEKKAAEAAKKEKARAKAKAEADKEKAKRKSGDGSGEAKAKKPRAPRKKKAEGEAGASFWGGADSDSDSFFSDSDSDFSESSGSDV